MSDLQPAVAGQHVDLDAALDHADRHREAVEDGTAALAQRALDGRHGCGNRPLDVVGLAHGQVLELVEVLDQVAGDLDGVLGDVRVGAMRAGRVDLEHEAQRALLAEPDHAGRRGLAVQDAVAAELVRELVDQPLGAPGAAGLLVRDAGEGKAAGELLAQAVQVDVGPHGRRRAAFHVDDAAAVHPAASTAPLQGSRDQVSAGPAGKHVDVPVEDEVRACAAAAERADHVGHFRLRRAVGDGHAVRLQLIVQEGRTGARVAGRIGARHAHELGEEADERLPIPIDPTEDGLAHTCHFRPLCDATGQVHCRRKHSASAISSAENLP